MLVPRKGVAPERVYKLSLEEIDNHIKKLRVSKDTSFVIRLLEKVTILKDRDCWILNDSWDEYASIDGKVAHRIFYELFVGEIVGKRYICHKCDRKGCVNYEHLFQGTPGQNQRDWRDKRERYLEGRKIEFMLSRIETGKYQDPNKVIKSWRDYS